MIAQLRRFFFSTLRRQLLFGVAVVFAVLMALFLLDTVHRQEALILDRQVEHATVLSKSLAASSAIWISAKDVSGLQELVDVLKDSPDLAFAMVLDGQGRVLAHTDRRRIGHYVGDLPALEGERILQRSKRLVDIVAPARIGAQHVGWARIGLDQHTTGRRIAQLKRDGLLYATGAILMGYLLAWLMARRITRRLGQIQQTVDQVHRGDGAARTRVEGHDEASGLAAEFNRMLDALEERSRERDRAEQALKATTQELDAYFNGALDLFAIADLEGRLRKVNPAWERVLGYRPGGLENRLFMELVHPEDRQGTLDAMAVLANQHPVSGCVNRYRHRDGSWCWIEWSSQTDGVWIFIAGHDITERKHAEEERSKLEAQLLQAQKMDSLGSLAGGIAHDMNNVLGAILLLASTNRGPDRPPENDLHDFDTIAKAALRGRNMVEALLRFARQDPVEAKVMDLNALIIDEMRLLQRTTLARIQVDLDLDPNLKPMRGDANALSQVLMNLCVNAVDAISGQGTLTLRTRNLGEDRIAMIVEDNGCGMAPEVLAKAFDPFYTTKPQGKGTGLGLTMVYSTVKAHQGEVQVHSEPGRGTRFQLSFPASDPLPLPSEARSSRTDGADHPLRILLVDDDELIRESLGGLLDTMGHQVTLASLGEEGLAHMEAGFRPDWVILDMNMPGLGGAGTLRAMKALVPDLPVVLATGRADQNALNLVASYSQVFLLQKPFTIQELCARLGG